MGLEKAEAKITSVMTGGGKKKRTRWRQEYKILSAKETWRMLKTKTKKPKSQSNTANILKKKSPHIQQTNFWYLSFRSLFYDKYYSAAFQLL